MAAGQQAKAGIKHNRQAMGTLDKAVKGGDGGDVKDDVQLATVLVWGRPHR